MIKRSNDPLKEIRNKQNVVPIFSANARDFEKAQIRPKRVLALGDPSLATAIKRDLNGKEIDVECFQTAKGLLEKASGREEAVIYCAPLLRSEILSIHKSMRKKSKMRNMNFFAVVPEWLNSFKEREMYKRGIRMIFEWPRERETFSETFAEALDSEILQVDSSDTDESLRKALLNRVLSQKGEFNSNLEINVYNGIVILRGAVESVGERHRLSLFIKSVPGVRGVVDSSLHVGKAPLPGYVKMRANQMLTEMADVPEQTLLVECSSDEQKLILLGTAPDQETMDRAQQQLALFKGVKSVRSEVEISPRAHSRDLSLAKLAQRVVNKITMGHPRSAHVKVLHGEAYLDGEVLSTIESSQLEKAIGEIVGIQKVSNQLTIDPMRATSSM